jgi:hypothetical protein
LEHHPDRAHGKEGVEVKFLAIQEAYEILTGKRRGKEVEEGPASGWDFHDWFWRFKFSRRSGAAAQAPPPPEATRERLREQLSGLKAKAAAKRAAGPRRAAHATQASNPSEAAASSVWRSTTKNARTTQQKPAKNPTVHTAFASQTSTTTRQERLHAETESATRKTVEEDKGPQHTAPFTSSSSSPSSSPDSTTTATSTETTTEEQELKAWHSLLTKAVHVVHNLHDRHTHSVTTHAQRIQSHISSIGSKLSQRLQLHALHELMPELTIHHSINTDTFKTDFSQWKPSAGFRFSASATISNAFGHQNSRSSDGSVAGIPSESDLHMLFSNSVHHHENSGRSSADDGEWQGYSNRMDAHSRKFADKEHVKSRLSHQLTGLKRKNQIKREFDGWN